MDHNNVVTLHDFKLPINHDEEDGEEDCEFV